MTNVRAGGIRASGYSNLAFRLRRASISCVVNAEAMGCQVGRGCSRPDGRRDPARQARVDAARSETRRRDAETRAVRALRVAHPRSVRITDRHDYLAAIV